MRIEDGKGKGFVMSVSAAQRGNVSSKTAKRAYYVSRDDGQAFNAVYTDINAAAGDYVAYLKNTSTTRNLFVDHIEFHSVENVKWKIWGATGTAASGETVTPANLNRISGKEAESTAMAGNTSITGLTTTSLIGTHRSQALGESAMEYGGTLILGPGDAIVIEYDTGTTGDCSLDLFYWFETIGFS